MAAVDRGGEAGHRQVGVGVADPAGRANRHRPRPRAVGARVRRRQPIRVTNAVPTDLPDHHLRARSPPTTSSSSNPRETNAIGPLPGSADRGRRPGYRRVTSANHCWICCGGVRPGRAEPLVHAPADEALAAADEAQGSGRIRPARPSRSAGESSCSDTAVTARRVVGTAVTSAKSSRPRRREHAAPGRDAALHRRPADELARRQIEVAPTVAPALDGGAAVARRATADPVGRSTRRLAAGVTAVPSTRAGPVDAVAPPRLQRASRPAATRLALGGRRIALLAVAITVMMIALGIGMRSNDSAIDEHLGTATATVLSVSLLRTGIEFVDATGRDHPARGRRALPGAALPRPAVRRRVLDAGSADRQGRRPHRGGRQRA